MINIRFNGYKDGYEKWILIQDEVGTKQFETEEEIDIFYKDYNWFYYLDESHGHISGYRGIYHIGDNCGIYEARQKILREMKFKTIL